MIKAVEEALNKKIDELKDIDIDKELELIKQKKSNLSKRLRDMVVRRYFENHKEAK